MYERYLWRIEIECYAECSVESIDMMSNCNLIGESGELMRNQTKRSVSMQPSTKRVPMMMKPLTNFWEEAVLDGRVFRIIEAGQVASVVPRWNLVTVKTIAI